MNSPAVVRKRPIGLFCACALLLLSAVILAPMRANAAALDAAPPPGKDIATLAGGCFWSMQARFKLLKGVDSVTPGYAGGHTPNPTYEQVCQENTGYAETIQIVFDPKVLSYHELLNIYFHVVDPTTKDRQGPDVGSSYRSIIFYRDAAQKAVAEQAIQEIQGQHVWPAPIVTEVAPFTKFYPAEAYHFDYFAHHPDNPYCMFVVAPEVSKFKDRYRALLK